MIPIDYRSTPLIEIARAEIAGKVAEYLAAGGEIHRHDSPADTKPIPPRSRWVDASAILKRKAKGISSRERARLREMTEAL